MLVCSVLDTTMLHYSLIESTFLMDHTLTDNTEG